MDSGGMSIIRSRMGRELAHQHFLRNSEGVIPSNFLNWRIKWTSLQYPQKEERAWMLMLLCAR